jgi:hypothetical protein
VVLVLGLGLGLVVMAGLAIGLWVAGKDGTTQGQRLEIRTPQILVRPETMARRASDQALGRRGITQVQEDAVVTRYSEQTYMVFGTCLVDGVPAIYATTCTRTDGVYRVTKVLVNGSEVKP